MAEQATNRRLTVQDAAEVLGTSVDAVRMRARRGTLRSEKGPNGRLYVYLNGGVNGGSSETKHRLGAEPEALITAKDETIAVLREQLEAEREAHREARRIIAGLIQRVPEIEAAPASLGAPSEATGPPQSDRSPGPTHTPADANGGPSEAAAGAQRPWWRRVFGV